ncbi:MAG: extracellular solute-binding protein [Succinivibrio sp.]
MVTINWKLALLASASIYLNTAFSTELTIWEDVGKTAGISKAVAEFEKDTGCKVRVVGSDYVTHITQYVENKKNGGQIPDILMLPADRVGDVASSGYIVPLSSMKQEQASYLSSAVKAFTYKNEIYAVPRSVETMVVYYNQDLLKYPYEHFEDYEKMSHELKKQGKYGLIGKWDYIYFAYGFIRGYNGYIFGENSDGSVNVKDVGLASPGAIEGAEFLSRISSQLLPKDVIGPDGFTKIEDYFTQGKAAAVITGPWELELIAKSGVNFGVAPLPKLPNGNSMCPFLGFRGYAITKDCKQKALAEKLLKYINKTSHALERYGVILELPPLHEVLDQPIIRNDDFANAIAVQAMTSEPTPSVPEMAKVWDPANKALFDVLSGKVSAKNAMVRAKNEIDRSIGNPVKAAKVKDEVAPPKENEETSAKEPEVLAAPVNETVSEEEQPKETEADSVQEDALSNEGVEEEAFVIEVNNAPSEESQAPKTEPVQESLSLDSLDFG